MNLISVTCNPGGLLAACLRRAAGRTLAGACLAMMVAGCAQLPPVLMAPTPTREISAQPPAAEVSAQPGAADCPAEKLVISNLRWFRDTQGAWRVVGTIHNGWDRAVSKLVTGTDPLDASGQVVDGHGEDISIYPFNLQPGTEAPFDAWIKRDFPGLDHFKVEAEECVVADNVERTRVEINKDRLFLDDARHAQVTGELANPGAKTVLVNGLKGVVFDAAGMPVAVESAQVTPRYLAPGESGPFRITLDLPENGAQLVKSYKLYMDVLVSEPRPAVLDVARDVQLGARSVDGDGQLHVTGQITNHGTVPLTVRLQAGLYDGPEKTKIIDAANLDTARPLAPRETRQFDVQDWGAPKARQALAPGQGQHTVELRVEPFQSWAATPEAHN